VQSSHWEVQCSTCDPIAVLDQLQVQQTSRNMPSCQSVLVRTRIKELKHVALDGSTV
jgi:hypothetical protein